MKNRKRHTFVDLLIMMAIMVILISIMLPAVIKCREWGKSIQCKNNLRNIGTAIFSYAGDFSGRAPLTNFGGGGYTTTAWSYTLMADSYLPTVRVNRTKSSYGPQSASCLDLVMNLNGGYDSRYYVWRYYPRSYNNVFACPSEKLDYADFYTCAQLGLAYLNEQTANYVWLGASHYSIWRPLADTTLGAKPMRTWRAQNSKPLIFDYWSNGMTMAGTGRMYWGRHWGRASNFKGAGAAYSYLGSAQINIFILDGHVESTNDKKEFEYTNKTTGGWTNGGRWGFYWNDVKG